LHFRAGEETRQRLNLQEMRHFEKVWQLAFKQRVQADKFKYKFIKKYTKNIQQAKVNKSHVK